MVDIEADGQIPSDYSMVCFDTVILESGLAWTFVAGHSQVVPNPRRKRGPGRAYPRPCCC
jgi:hypothetical protein